MIPYKRDFNSENVEQCEDKNGFMGCQIFSMESGICYSYKIQLFFYEAVYREYQYFELLCVNKCWKPTVLL